MGARDRGLGGVLGVLFTIPLRRALIIDQPLQFPEGVATAEVLKVGQAGGGSGARHRGRFRCDLQGRADRPPAVARVLCGSRDCRDRKSVVLSASTRRPHCCRRLHRRLQRGASSSRAVRSRWIFIPSTTRPSSPESDLAAQLVGVSAADAAGLITSRSATSASAACSSAACGRCSSCASRCSAASPPASTPTRSARPAARACRAPSATCR